ncbi:putative serine/threonine protein phosphatase [Synechococcus phage S-CBWM1]|uniref:Putative serine/threonine protein phosphatase n=1 Tax=Synechococcus phage S-CBWM1 TaxID=2053653 RepID=A0A3G1L3H2_9CAUD|nr:NinI-like serine-threonine phosphatase [Synechococcus phage S-CBWM1]ATW62731.1 putative serine/threonine protein phosphatase [Synechococcus phage S-CBWM1]
MNNKKISPYDVVAVGDIHGSYDLLSSFVRSVRGTGAIVIFLGDLVDRGSGDVECLTLVRSMNKNPEKFGLSAAHCLLGNHESLMVNALSGDKMGMVDWIGNGGAFWKSEVLKQFVPWLKTLPYVMTDASTGTVFSHAGLIPGEDPDETIRSGRANSLIWIREPFLTSGPEFEKYGGKYRRAVHGHSWAVTNDGFIMTEPDISKSGDRVGIDTAAYVTGVLTAFNSTTEEFYQMFRE